MKIWYMSGAGNDFVVIDVRGKRCDLQEMAVSLCREYGSDGFMALDTSEIADVKLHFYNADGLRGEMCGNGARCFCRFAYENGIVGEQMTVETDAGLLYGRRLGEEQYCVRLQLPDVVDLQRKKGIAYVELGKPGVPHAVVERTELSWKDREDLRALAKGLRYDEVFEKGANINFYTILGPNEVRILTYERGVEDYTLACGTGSAATAVVLWAEGRLQGGDVTVHNPGGILKIRLQENEGELCRIELEGPAAIVKTIPPLV